MFVFLLSLGGIPPTAGFIGKYFLFAAAVQAGFGWLAIIAVLMSAVSMFYYLRFVVAMYLRDGRTRTSAITGRCGSSRRSASSSRSFGICRTAGRPGRISASRVHVQRALTRNAGR
jgi:NADH:ubiquinone oxidoreductase subunit 2 (subunit N)